MLQLNREQHLTFVWVTHAREVASQAQRLITMRDGRIAEDTARELSAAAPVPLSSPHQVAARGKDR
jgi:putative ABC transport system ATP-binding protein